MAFINPFLELFETKHRPHARTLRTSFWTKLKDASHVIGGRLFSGPRESKHLGLVDIATLGIPFLIVALAWRCYQGVKTRDRPGLIVPLIFLAVPAILMQTLRVGLTLALTGATSLITGIVAFVSYFSGRNTRKTALALDGTSSYEHHHAGMQGMTTHATLREFLRQNGESLDDLTIQIDAPDQAVQAVADPQGQHIWTARFFLPAGPKGRPTFTIDLNALRHNAQMRAAMELNVGGITAQFEQRSSNALLDDYRMYCDGVLSNAPAV